MVGKLNILFCYELPNRVFYKLFYRRKYEEKSIKNRSILSSLPFDDIVGNRLHRIERDGGQ